MIRLRELGWHIEAWFILRKVRKEEKRNPEFRNMKPPADLYDKVMQRIRESESNHE